MTGNFGFIAFLIFSRPSLRFDRYGVAAFFESVPSKLSLAACSNGIGLAAGLCRLLHQREARSIASLARMRSDFRRHIEPFGPLGGGLFQSPMERLAAPPDAVNMQMRNLHVSRWVPRNRPPSSQFLAHNQNHVGLPPGIPPKYGLSAPRAGAGSFLEADLFLTSRGNWLAQTGRTSRGKRRRRRNRSRAVVRRISKVEGSRYVLNGAGRWRNKLVGDNARKGAVRSDAAERAAWLSVLPTVSITTHRPPST